MNLPNQSELLKAFSSFLIESGLSAVSVKNYLCDLRHFLAFCATIQPTESQILSLGSPELNIEEVFQSISKYINDYSENQKSVFTPQSTANRRLASVRRFTTFLNVKYGISNNLPNTNNNTSNISNISPKIEIEQNTSSSLPTPTEKSSSTVTSVNPLTTEKILNQFRSHLEKEKKTHSTVKNYLSDLNHFFLWTANQTPYTIHNLVNILSEAQLYAYITYLKLSRTSVSVINRRQSSIKKLARFCAIEKYIPENPFEIKLASQPLAPLSWIERLSNRKPKKSSDAPKTGLAIIYSKYNALPFTPYLHIAILVLVTSAIAIFGYNQIISSARPSSAATALTPPKRQLSFQGRLTDSSGTPITTSMTVGFKLFNVSSGGAALYQTTPACTVVPDVNGIFNTLIGDGTCGAEINSSVFTDNRDVYLEITVGAETLTPRQQIATVGYALNTETLQGYPASASATANTVPVMDNDGNIVLSQLNPSIIATPSSGTFTLKGDVLSLQTSLNSGGDIILQPDALGQGQILALGGTTDQDSFRVTNANLTTGSLISGYVGNDDPFGRLISLTSGSTETDRLWVMTDGRTNINSTATESALIINQNGSGNLFSASSSGVTKFTVANNGDVNISGQYLINGSPFSGSNWQRTSGSLAPLNTSDSLNLGNVATNSATVHLAGTSGENSFINTGGFGIGKTNPGTALDVVGVGTFSTGLTLTGGALNLTSTSGAINATGLGASTISTTSNNLTLSTVTSGTLALTSAGALNLSAGAASTFTLPSVVNAFNIDSDTLTIDAANNRVGVGITNPGFGLEVNDTARINGNFTIGDASGDTVISNANAWTFANATTVALNNSVNSLNFDSNTLTIDAANNRVGIGITNPTTALDVVGVGTFSTGLTLTGGALNLTSTSGAINATGLGASTISTTSNNLTLSTVTSGTLALTSAGALNLSAGAASTFTLPSVVNAFNIDSDTLTIDAANNRVGVGITNPTYALDVVGELNLTDAIRAGGDAGSSGWLLTSSAGGVNTWTDPTTLGGTSLWQRTSGSLAPLYITDAINLGSTATTSALIHFPGTTDNDAWFNLGTGNLGVGTTTPTYKFQVAFSGGTGLGKIGLHDSSGTGNSVLSLHANGGTERARIDTNGDSWINPVSGNVGIGISTPSYKLDVVGELNLTDAIRAGGSAGTTGFLLTSSGGGVNTWTDPNTISGSNYWQRNAGALSPVEITNDLIIGGTATASAKFQVFANSGNASSSGSFTFRGTNPSTINILNGNRLDFLTSAGGDAGLSSSRLTIDSTGNVGIGLTNPAYNLDVTGELNLTDAIRAGGDAGSSGFLLTSSAGGVNTWTDPATVGTNFWQRNSGALSPAQIWESINLGNVATNSATVHLAGVTGEDSFINTGNFGIGITNPTGDLHVDSGAGSSNLYLTNTAGNSRILFADTAQTNFAAIGELAGGLALSGTGNVTSTPGVYLNNSNFVGIGTTTPTALLDIAGDASASGSFVLRNSSLSTIDMLDGGRLAFQTSPGGDAGLTERMTLLNNGYVGLATTNPSGRLDISDGTLSMVFGADSSLTTRTNATQKIARIGSYHYTNAEEPVAFAFVGNGSSANNISIGGGTALMNSATNINFYTASNVTTLTGTERMRIDSSGNVGIGTTTPTALLDIAGNASTSGSLTFRGTNPSTINILNGNRLDFLTSPGGDSALSAARLTVDGTGNIGIGITNPSQKLVVAGNIYPSAASSYNLGGTGAAWNNLFLTTGINNNATGAQMISIANSRLTGTDWNVSNKLGVGTTTAPTATLDVTGNAHISTTLTVDGISTLTGDVSVGGGIGKIDVGLVDPPYTINGEKFATYMASMIGVKEETVGKILSTDLSYIEGLGYRTLIDLDAQPKGSDLWLFSKTTNMRSSMSKLSVLLTAAGQAKTWYEVDTENKILAIYSSTPTDVNFRLTAPRFDAARWTNVRTSNSVGYVLTDSNNNPNTGPEIFSATAIAPELILQADNTYKLKINGNETQEVSSFASSIVANFKAGLATVNELFVDNLTINTKLVSPIADIDQLKVIDATISGTLYADNIKGQTVDRLNEQLDLLSDKYGTASAILADLQSKYTSYASILGATSSATITGSNPLELSPLASISAETPSDLALNYLNVHTIIANDVMANGSVFAQAISSFDTDLFIQPSGDKKVNLLAGLMVLHPEGKIEVRGDLVVTGTIYANNIDTRTATVSGSLALGKGELATNSGKLIALFGDNGQVVGSIDASGSANFGQLTTDGLIIASGNANESASSSAQTTSNTTIGIATIATGSSELAVANSKVTSNTLIYITPISDTNNQVLFVKSKQAGVGFTVAVPTALPSEVSFNYWLVQTK